eukprot:359854-Chlamydomonas_euryale.AAC.3
MQLQRALRGIRSLDHLANAFGRPDCFQLRILEAGDVQTATPEGTNRASAELYMPTEAGRRQQCSRLIQPAVQVTRHAAPSGAPGKLPAARLWIDCHAFQCVAGRRRRGRYGVPGRGCAFDSAACAIGSWQRRRLRHRCACCKQGLSASVSVEGGRVAVVVPVEGSRRAHGAGACIVVRLYALPGSARSICMRGLEHLPRRGGPCTKHVSRPQVEAYHASGLGHLRACMSSVSGWPRPRQA